MLRDNSIQALIWRARTRNGSANLREMKEVNETLGSARTNQKLNFMETTVIGKHNGIPWGQSQYDGWYKEIDLRPYPTAKNPFLSDSVEDMYPRTYGEVNPMGGTNGEIRNVSSGTGAPLSISLNDQTELEDRMYRERFRVDPKNPLSASFAQEVEIMNETNRMRGPMTDYMRTNLKENADEQMVLDRKVATGFLRTYAANENENDVLSGYYNRKSTIFSGDRSDFKDYFQPNNLPDKVGQSIQGKTQENDTSSTALVTVPGQEQPKSSTKEERNQKRKEIIEEIYQKKGEERPKSENILDKNTFDITPSIAPTIRRGVQNPELDGAYNKDINTYIVSIFNNNALLAEYTKAIASYKPVSKASKVNDMRTYVDIPESNPDYVNRLKDRIAIMNVADNLIGSKLLRNEFSEGDKEKMNERRAHLQESIRIDNEKIQNKIAKETTDGINKPSGNTWFSYFSPAIDPTPAKSGPAKSTTNSAKTGPGKPDLNPPLNQTEKKKMTEKGALDPSVTGSTLGPNPIDENFVPAPNPKQEDPMFPDLNPELKTGNKRAFTWDNEEQPQHRKSTRVPTPNTQYPSDNYELAQKLKNNVNSFNSDGMLNSESARLKKAKDAPIVTKKKKENNTGRKFKNTLKDIEKVAQHLYEPGVYHEGIRHGDL